MKKRTQLHISSDFVKRLEGIGLTKEQIDDLRNMNRESAIEWIRQFQNSLPKVPKDFVPEIGKHIEWIDIAEMVFRVLDFNRNGTFVDIDRGAESVKAQSKFEPYGYLLVESPTLNQPVWLPIIHNNDFWLTASVFDDPNLSHVVSSDSYELLVTYAPKRMTKHGHNLGLRHCLHFVITPRGTLEHYYSDDSSGDNRMSKPEPELLFGHFTYNGEIKVQVNKEPDL